jgi:hypothetical protein
MESLEKTNQLLEEADPSASNEMKKGRAPILEVKEIQTQFSRLFCRPLLSHPNTPLMSHFGQTHFTISSNKGSTRSIEKARL